MLSEAEREALGSEEDEDRDDLQQVKLSEPTEQSTSKRHRRRNSDESDTDFRAESEIEDEVEEDERLLPDELLHDSNALQTPNEIRLPALASRSRQRKISKGRETIWSI
jgi:hypothetical protein